MLKYTYMLFGDGSYNYSKNTVTGHGILLKVLLNFFQKIVGVGKAHGFCALKITVSFFFGYISALSPKSWIKRVFFGLCYFIYDYI